MISSFVLSPARRRFTWIVSLVAAIFALLAIVAVLANYGAWVTADAAYWEWNSGDKAARCKQMYADAKPHMTRLQCDIDNDSLSVYRWLDCLNAHDNNQPEIVRAFANSKCPTKGEIEFGGRHYGNLIIVPPEHPGSLVSYTWTRNGIKPLLPPAAFIALTVFLYMLCSIARSFLMESHVGWRRLAIVASVVSSVAVPVIIADDLRSPDPELIFVSIVALIVTASSILYGRKVFLWVCSGFNPEAQPGPSPKSSQPVLNPSSLAAHYQVAPLSDPQSVSSQLSAEIKGTSFHDLGHAGQTIPYDTVAASSTPSREYPGILAWPFANRYPRGFARIFDFWLESYVVGVIAVVLFGRNPDFANWISQPGSGISFGILCVPLALLLDAGLYQLFGNSPGKAMLGIKVASLTGRPLSFGQYVTRNFSLWLRGFALGMPVIFLFALWRQELRMRSGLQTSYDEKLSTRVWAQPISGIREFGFWVAFVTLLVIQVMSNTAA